MARSNLEARARRLRAQGNVQWLDTCPKCGGAMLNVLTVGGYCPPCKYPDDIIPLPPVHPRWTPKTFLKISDSVAELYEESIFEPLRGLARADKMITAIKKDTGPLGRPRALDETILPSLLVEIARGHSRWTLQELVERFRDSAHKQKLAPKTMQRFLNDNHHALAKAGFELIATSRPRRRRRS
jgi:hypothetical protein